MIRGPEWATVASRVAGLVLLACLAVERGCAMVIDREDLSDLRFQPFLYVGRRLPQVSIDSDVSRGVVRIANRGGALRDVRLTAKYFGHMGRRVVEKRLDRLPGGLTITIRAPEEILFLDLGMIYVKLSCDRGVQVHKGWFSYWN